MKKIYYIFALLLSTVLFSCSNDELVGATENDEVGYISLDIKTVNTTYTHDSRAVPGNYDPKTLCIEIKNSKGEVVKSTDDASQWIGQNIELLYGTYTVSVHSANWDGSDAGRDIPFYAGSATVNVRPKTKTDVSIVCSLANVKVSVVFDRTVSDAFRSAVVEVSSETAGVEKQTFVMNYDGSLQPAYFPAGQLTARLIVTNFNNEQYEISTPLDAQPRDHFILKYTTTPTADGKFNITYDDAMKSFTYTFTVPIKASTTLAMNNVNAWSNFAWAEGSIPSADITIVDSNVKMQYKAESDADWTDMATVNDNGTYKATLQSLQPATKYAVKLVYDDGANVFYSPEKTFQTEAATQMPNSSLDDWFTGKFGNNNCVYPCTQAYWDANGGSFWGTSNAGTSLLNRTVTSQESSIVHTAGGSSAKLQSSYIVIQFAAASLFAGTFKELVGTKGGKIDFGKPFTSRPSQLKGWFKYSSGAINRVGTLPSYLNGVIQKNVTVDTWSCYVALMTEQFEYDNSSTDKASSQKYVSAGTMPDFDNDPRVVAYGEMPISQCVAQSDWTQFNVNLNYHDLNKKPSYIVLVISSSRYGDFFTGCDTSTLYIDDLELVYDDPTK